MVTNQQPDRADLPCVLRARRVRLSRRRREGFTWALRASPRARRAEWEAFLCSLPGEPTMVVCHDDQPILSAVCAVWPNTSVKLCEHHLRANAIKHLRHYGHAGVAGERITLFVTLFTAQAPASGGARGTQPLGS